MVLGKYFDRREYRGVPRLIRARDYAYPKAPHCSFIGRQNFKLTKRVLPLRFPTPTPRLPHTRPGGNNRAKD
jgi:hypothetical protein